MNRLIPCHVVDYTVPPKSLRALVCRIVPALLVAVAAVGCGEDESARRVDPPVPVAAPRSAPCGVANGAGTKWGRLTRDGESRQDGSIRKGI